jgi:spoIIIJ-associated protein
MDRYVEKTGKNVDEAIEKALEELDADRDSVEIEVLEEGNKGILAILGGKSARVRVSLKNRRKEEAEAFLRDLFVKMGVSARVNAREDDEKIEITIEGSDSGIIIGKRGETLDAIQYLTGLVVNKGSKNFKRIVIDVENYREKRKRTLVGLAKKLADKAVEERKSITLEPMNPYERRIIHSTLQFEKNVKTYSIGDEPNRKVVISFKPN